MYIHTHTQIHKITCAQSHFLLKNSQDCVIVITNAVGLLQAKVALFIGYCVIDQYMTCCNLI